MWNAVKIVNWIDIQSQMTIHISRWTYDFNLLTDTSNKVCWYNGMDYFNKKIFLEYLNPISFTDIVYPRFYVLYIYVLYVRLAAI